ncbi:MAG TPA: hypothetical protein HPQ04_09195 [Rhodospirillaceae bacterium]|nr:hypothetical protein [Rhodospirillaceae bacterium]
MPASEHSSPEQLKALFQTLLRKIPAAADRRQLEDATCAALQLMLRRTGDRELLASLQRQARDIIGSLPETGQSEDARADLRRASGRCIDLLKQAKKLRKPRPPRTAAAAREKGRKSSQAVKAAFGLAGATAFIAAGIWLWQVTDSGKHTAADLAHQFELAASGENILVHVFGGPLRVEKKGDLILVVAEKVPAATCVSAAWQLARKGTVSINHVTTQRVTAASLSEMCHEEDDGATLAWSPAPPTNK